MRRAGTGPFIGEGRREHVLERGAGRQGVLPEGLALMEREVGRCGIDTFRQAVRMATMLLRNGTYSVENKSFMSMFSP